MSVIFGCSRVVPVPRTDYQRIRERFSFRNVYLYSLNLEETDNTVRIHSVADLFAVYMSPYLSNFDISLASIIIPAKFLLAKYIFKAQKKLKNSSSAFCFSQVFDPKGSVASSQSSTGKLLNETSCKILQQTNGKTLSQTNRNRFF